MLSDLSPAAIALIGAAIAGTVAVIVQKQKSADERKAQLREKLEALMLAIFEHEQFMDLFRLHVLFDATAPTGIPPIARAQTLAAIYAAELLPAVSAYERASINYQGYLTGKSVAIKSNPNADLTSDYLDAVSPFLGSRFDLVQKIQRHIDDQIVIGRL